MKDKKKETKEVEYIEEVQEERLDEFQHKIKKIKEKLKLCQKEKEEYLKGWQRERADFINYKKKEEERIFKKYKEAKKEIISKILEAVDNFELAEKSLTKELRKNDWTKGILSIKKQLLDILEKEGVKEIKDNKIFNPEIHEAVAIEERDDNESDDKILEILQRGYYFENEVLRPVRVKVGKKINKNNT